MYPCQQTVTRRERCALGYGDIHFVARLVQPCLIQQAFGEEEVGFRENRLNLDRLLKSLNCHRSGTFVQIHLGSQKIRFRRIWLERERVPNPALSAAPLIVRTSLPDSLNELLSRLLLLARRRAGHRG